MALIFGALREENVVPLGEHLSSGDQSCLRRRAAEIAGPLAHPTHVNARVTRPQSQIQQNIYP